MTIDTTGDSTITAFTLVDTDGDGEVIFDINTTGHISVKNSSLLNYEDTSEYTITVTATNSAGTSAAEQLTINVTNVYENIPVLVAFSSDMDENATTNTLVGQVQEDVSNTDNAPITSFNLIGSDASKFDINSTGHITTNTDDFSYTTKDTYTFEVNATNSIGTSSNKTITISIQDVPTETITLHSLQLDIKEGTPAGTEIGQIQIDSGDTAITDINITSTFNTHDNAFNISTNGVITVSNSAILDFETRTQYQFYVKAYNTAGESNQVAVTINILYVENLYILSAVYDNNNTTLDGSSNPIVDDDTLYLYFSKTVDTDTFSNDKSDDFNISNGLGAIGSGSTTNYSDLPYHLYTIKGDLASGSLAFTPNVTKIAISPQELTDDNGSYPTEYVTTTIEAFKHIVKTGQTISYDNNGTEDNTSKDDGYYENGISQSFTRDDTNNIVFDNAQNIIWEDTTNTENIVGSWNSADSYCAGLDISTYTNWRLPTINEWINITNKTKYNPTIDTTYFNNNTDSGAYWSSTIDASNSGNYWLILITKGSTHVVAKTSDTRYVRCVHDK